MSSESLLATSFTDHLLCTITTLQNQLVQLEHEHSQLSQAITATSSASVTEAEMASMKAMMAQVSTYHTKLLSLRSTMAMLPARSKQLQKRADQLKTTKLQYLSQIDDIRRVEQERDQAIVAKVAPLYIKPESPEPTPVSSASLRTTASTSTATVSVATASVVKKVSTKTKKKKKIKVREVEIGDESSPGWELKPSLSQQDLTYNKHP